MSGSMLNFSFLHDKKIIAAGLLRENVGMMEKPLLVRPSDPEKDVLVESV